MRERGIFLVSRTKVILGIQFVLSGLLILVPYRSSLNQLLQIGIMALSALFYVYEPVSAISSIVMFNILPTTVNTATSTGSATGGYYLGYKLSWILLLVLAAVYLLMHRNELVIRRQKWRCIGFGAYMFISQLWASDTTYYSDTFYLLIGIYIVFPLLINGEEDIRFVWNTFILASVILTVQMVLYTLRSGTIQESGSLINSNYLSLTTMIMLTLNLSYLLDNREYLSKGFKTLLGLLIGCSAFLLISYASRTAFLILIAYILMIIAMLIKENRKALIGLICTTVIAVILIFSLGIYEYLASTFFEDNFETGNGRTLLWAQYLREFSNENIVLKIFGRGFHIFRAQFLSYKIFAHNSYLSILIDFGLVGLLLFATNIISCVQKMAKMKQYSMAIAAFAIGIYLIAIDGYQDSLFATYFAFITAYASYLPAELAVENKR